ncbi:MAG: MATE family efflux transporter [Flavobacteriales bacterium]
MSQSSTFKSHLKANLHISIPIIVGQLGQIATSVADNVMIGNAGSEQIAAASLANGIFFFFFVIGIGFSMSLTPLVAEAFTQKKLLKTLSFFKNSLVAHTVLGLVLILAVLCISLILDKLGQNPEIVELSAPYLQLQALSILPVLLFLSYKQFLEGLADTKAAMTITIIANLINIGLNAVLIYGYFGFPAYGLFGAGIATLASRILMFVAIFVYFQWTSRYQELRVWFAKAKINRTILNKLKALGWPIGLQFAFEVSAFGGASILAGWIDEASLAAHQVALNLASTTWSIATGFGAAVTVRIAQAQAKRQSESILPIAYSGYVLSLAWMTFSGIIFFYFGYPLADLYLDDPEIVMLASQLIFVAVLFQISDGAQVVGLGALRGLKDVNRPTWISFFSYWIVGIPIAYALAFHYEWGVEGVWYGLFAGLTTSAVLLFVRLRRFKSL